MWSRVLVGVGLVALAWLWILRRRRAEGSLTTPAPRKQSRWDPYAVLGLACGASPEEIARAYHAQMKLYHPDRVADLGRELQELAHRKALDIQRAYVELGGRR
jgi:preprotein translocase subunit Sec63